MWPHVEVKGGHNNLHFITLLSSWLVDWSVGQLVGRLVGRLVLVCGSVVQLFRRVTGRSRLSCEFPHCITKTT